MATSYRELRPQLFEALRDAFEEPEFERMLKIKCDRDLHDIVPRYEKFPDKVLGVMGNAERRKWLEELVRGARETNKGHERLEAVTVAVLAGIEAEGDEFYLRDLPEDEPDHTVPPQVLRQSAHFKGREELIEQVLAAIEPGKMVTLYGIGGIGKTAVAAEVVARLMPGEGPPERFPDGVIVHSFYEKPLSDMAFEHILTSLKITPSGDLAGEAQAALAGKKLLLVLDGAEDADSLDRVIDRAPSCGVLITSRRRSDGSGIKIEVERLPPEVSVAVIESWAERVKDEGEAVRAICELVEHWAVAVRIAGAYLDSSKDTAAEYLAELRESPLLMLDVSTGTEQHRKESMAVLLRKSLSMEQVGENGRQCMALLGRMAFVPFDLEPIAASLELGKGKVRKAIRDLSNVGMVDRIDSRYVVVHPYME